MDKFTPCKSDHFTFFTNSEKWSSENRKYQNLKFNFFLAFENSDVPQHSGNVCKAPRHRHPDIQHSMIPDPQISKIQNSWILVVRQYKVEWTDVRLGGSVQHDCSNDCNVCTVLTARSVKETHFTIHFKTSKHGILNKNVNFVFRVPVRRFSEQQRGLHPSPWGFRTPHWECSLFEHCLFFWGFIHWANENRVVGVDAHYFVSCFVPQLKKEHFTNSNSDQLLSAQPK